MVIAIIVVIWAVITFAAYRHPATRLAKLHRDLLAMAGFGLLTVAFFWQVLFLPDYSMPIGGGDLASFLYPVYSFAAESIQSGVLPLWNPYLYGGSPFAADMQSGLFYPINLLGFLLARPFTYQSLEGLVMVHYFLAGCFTYVYGRTLGLGRLPSFVSGIVFAYAGFSIAHLSHYNMLAAATWLPLILVFFHRAVTRGSLYAAVGASAFFGVAALAGHTQITLYIGLFLFIYWLWALIRQRSNDPGSAADWKPVVVTLPITGLLGILIAAVQLLPAYQLTDLSVRADMTFAAANAFRSAPLNLVTMVLPHFFGPSPADYWGLTGSLTETYAYVGLLPLILAALAIIFHRRVTPWWGFFTLSFVLFLLLSFGESTPLYGWVYKLVPGFDKVRAAGRFAFLFDFSLAILAGIGLNAITGKLPALWRRVFGRFTSIIGILLVAGVVIVAPLFYYALLNSQDKDPTIFQRYQIALDNLNLALVFLAIAVALLWAVRHWPSKRQLIGAAMAMLIVVDLFAANIGMNPTPENILAGYDHPQIVNFLQEEAVGYRVDTRTGIEDSWQPSATLLHGVADVMGVYNPMLLADYNTYWESLGSRSTSAYDLLGAKYVVANKDVVLDWAKFRPVVTDAPKLNVYENTKALPKAMVIPSAQVTPRDQMLEQLRSPRFDPVASVLLENALADAPLDNGATTGAASAATRPNPNEIILQAQSSGPGYLLLNEVYYPGWTCYVNGQEVPVMRANYVFQAIPLEAGLHQIRFVFAPRLFTIGWIVSTLAVILCLAVAALGLYKARAVVRKSASARTSRQLS